MGLHGSSYKLCHHIAIAMSLITILKHHVVIHPLGKYYNDTVQVQCNQYSYLNNDCRSSQPKCIKHRSILVYLKTSATLLEASYSQRQINSILPQPTSIQTKISLKLDFLKKLLKRQLNPWSWEGMHFSSTINWWILLGLAQLSDHIHIHLSSCHRLAWLFMTECLIMWTYIYSVSTIHALHKSFIIDYNKFVTFKL